MLFSFAHPPHSIDAPPVGNIISCMQPLVTALAMREIDLRATAEFGIPGVTLMEKAGAEVAGLILRERLAGVETRVLVLCGRGNNGGDGFVAARLLHQSGVHVTAVCIAEPSSLRGDARASAERLMESGVSIVELSDGAQLPSLLSQQGLIVDAIFGTGLSSAPSGAAAQAIRATNGSGLRVVSVDIPSGVDASSGIAYDPAIRADVTVTFGLEKLGLRLHPARALAGRVEVTDIGFPAKLLHDGRDTFVIEDADVRGALPPRPSDGHKGTFGTVLAVAGSTGYCGAAVLTAMGAVRAGAGLVRLAVPQSIASIVEASHLESVKCRLPDDGRGLLGAAALEPLLALAQNADCIAIGPGLGTDSTTAQLVSSLLTETAVPIVLDADGINCLVQNPDALSRRTAPTVLTPHPGEFARLTGIPPAAVKAGRVELARRFAIGHHCTLLLKGSPTATGTSDGVILLNPTGNSGLGSGGSGDVLTGLVAGLIAQGASPERAAYAAAFLHGRAADLAAARLTEYCLCARDVVEALPQAFKSILGDPPRPR